MQLLGATGAVLPYGTVPRVLKVVCPQIVCSHIAVRWLKIVCRHCCGGCGVTGDRAAIEAAFPGLNDMIDIDLKKQTSERGVRINVPAAAITFTFEDRERRAVYSIATERVAK